MDVFAGLDDSGLSSRTPSILKNAPGLLRRHSSNVSARSDRKVRFEIPRRTRSTNTYSDVNALDEQSLASDIKKWTEWIMNPSMQKKKEGEAASHPLRMLSFDSCTTPPTSNYIDEVRLLPDDERSDMSDVDISLPPAIVTPPSNSDLSFASKFSSRTHSRSSSMNVNSLIDTMEEDDTTAFHDDDDDYPEELGIDLVEI